MLKHIMIMCNHELRGQGHLGVEHRSPRDEEARELHLPGCTGLVQKERHTTNLEEHNTADLHTKMFGLRT